MKSVGPDFDMEESYAESNKHINPSIPTTSQLIILDSIPAITYAVLLFISAGIMYETGYSLWSQWIFIIIFFVPYLLAPLILAYSIISHPWLASGKSTAFIRLLQEFTGRYENSIGTWSSTNFNAGLSDDERRRLVYKISKSDQKVLSSKRDNANKIYIFSFLSAIYVFTLSAISIPDTPEPIVDVLTNLPLIEKPENPISFSPFLLLIPIGFLFLLGLIFLEQYRKYYLLETAVGAVADKNTP